MMPRLFKIAFGISAALAMMTATSADARYLQTDPIGYDDQKNLYAYVHSDPINNVDPDGKQTVQDMQLQSQIEDKRAQGLSEQQILQDVGEQAIAELSIMGTVAAVVVDVLDGPTPDVGAAAVSSTIARGAAQGPRAGRRFTQAGKREIDQRNAQANGGVNRCESCGQRTPAAEQSQRGRTPPGNQRERDHIVPRSRGGDGSPENGQVLCRDCNQEKLDRMPE